MNDFSDKPESSWTNEPQAVSEPVSEAVSEPGSETRTGPEIIEQPPEAPEAKQEPEDSPAVARFKSCRWKEAPDTGASYCSHRDVLPFAGKNGFNQDAWCPECSFFKVKRIVKKRPASEFDSYY